MLMGYNFTFSLILHISFYTFYELDETGSF